MLIDDRGLVVVDLETTGTSPIKDRIIEIGACRVDPVTFEVLECFETWVNPGVESTRDAFAIHGVRSVDLASAPDEATALSSFKEFCGASIGLAGHNVCFDASFLRAGLARAGISMDIDYHLLDAWSVARLLLPAATGMTGVYNLDTVCQLFELHRPSPHRALQDARATANVLSKLAALAGTIPQGAV